MKVIIDIDNDQIIGLLAIMGAKKETAVVKQYLAEHDSIDFNPELLGEEATQLQLAVAAMAIGQIAENEKKPTK